MREAILDFLSAVLPFGFGLYLVVLCVWTRGAGCLVRGHDLQRQRRVLLRFDGGARLGSFVTCTRCNSLLQEREP